MLALLSPALALLLLLACRPALALDTTTAAFPLAVAKNGRYLVDQAGKPFRINADAAWFMSTQATASEVDAYLENRKAKGFNTFVLALLTHLTPENRAGEAPFKVADDLATPNDAYFTFADSIIDKAAAHGMAVILAYTYLGYQGGNDGWWSAITSARNPPPVCTNWGVWLGTRYRDRKNLIWLAGGDHMPPAGSEGERRVRRILDGIRAAGARQLVAAQWNDPDTLATDAAAFADAIELNTIYGYGPARSGETYRTAQRAYRLEPPRPVMLFEPIYEDEPVGGTGLRPDVRRSQYWAVLGGATAGQNFGTRGVWNWLQPSWADWLHNRRQSWRDKLDSPGSLDMQRLFALFAALPWQDLVPVDGLARLPAAAGSEAGGLRHIAVAATPDRSWLLAYVPPTGVQAQTFDLDMAAMAGAARVRWYNPATGAYTPVAASLANAGVHPFSTPGNNGTGTNDWVLVADVPARTGTP